MKSSFLFDGIAEFVLSNENSRLDALIVLIMTWIKIALANLPAISRRKKTKELLKN